MDFLVGRALLPGPRDVIASNMLAALLNLAIASNAFIVDEILVAS